MTTDVDTRTPEEIEAGAPVKKQKRYQPTYPDGHELAGQPMGGEQVIEYDGTEDDLFAKMVANTNRIQAEMRKMSRDKAVDPAEDEEPLPTGALTRKKENFSRRDFTTEERVKFAKGLANPNTIQETFDEMVSSRVGSNEEFKNMTALQIQTSESNAGMRFGREHPEITAQPNNTPYTNPYGQKAMVPRDVALLLSWCDKRDLYHTYNNLVLAWERLKKAGLLSEAPIVEDGTRPKTQPAADPSGADSPDPDPQPQRRQVPTSSALPVRNSPTGQRPVTRGGPTWKDIEELTVQQLAGKPAEWKSAAKILFRRQTGEWVDRNLKPGMAMTKKLEALGS